LILYILIQFHFFGLWLKSILILIGYFVFGKTLYSESSELNILAYFYPQGGLYTLEWDVSGEYWYFDETIGL
jgi:hypothetical protein